MSLGDGDDTYKNKGGKAGLVAGGDGDDTLIAGKSEDKFVFGTTLNPATNVDRIKEFELGRDKLVLSQVIFSELSLSPVPGSAFQKGKKADDPDDYIIYQKKSGKLFYDEDGNDSLGKVPFARLDKGQKLSADDFSIVA